MSKLITFFKKLSYHPNKNKRTFITVVYSLAALCANYFLLQVFCVPVLCAAVLFVLFLLSLVLFPYLKNKIAKVIAAFFLGIGVVISLYLFIFLVDPWSGSLLRTPVIYLLYAIFFMLGGVFAFLPLYYLYHIYRYFAESSRLIRVALSLGAVSILIVIVIYLTPFQKELDRFYAACGTYNVHHNGYSTDMDHPELFTPNLYTEQFLGIGIKYHTMLDYMYDGWRPPVHDPLLNVGLWLYSNTYYPCKNLNRVKYYKLIFPNRSYKVCYPCSYTYDGMSYFQHY